MTKKTFLSKTAGSSKLSLWNQQQKKQRYTLDCTLSLEYTMGDISIHFWQLSETGNCILFAANVDPSSRSETCITCWKDTSFVTTMSFEQKFILLADFVGKCCDKKTLPCVMYKSPHERPKFYSVLECALGRESLVGTKTQ